MQNAVANTVVILKAPMTVDHSNENFMSLKIKE